MDLDDGTSMLLRVPPSGSDFASDSDQEDSPELPSAGLCLSHQNEV